MNGDRKNEASGWGCLGAVAMGLLSASALFVFSPGILTVSYFRHSTRAAWDTGQVWAYAISVSLALWAGLWILTRRFRTATRLFLGLSFLCAWASGLSYFGWKAEFAQAALPVFLPPSRNAAVMDRAENFHLSVSFKNMPADRALEYLSQASRQIDPARKGVRLIYVSHHQTPPPLVSETYRETSVLDIVKSFCIITRNPQLQYWVAPDAISLFPVTETLD